MLGSFGRASVPQRLKKQSLYHEILLLQKFNDIFKVLKPKKNQPPTSEKMRLFGVIFCDIWGDFWVIFGAIFGRIINKIIHIWALFWDFLSNFEWDFWTIYK